MQPFRLIIWDIEDIFWHGPADQAGSPARPELAALLEELAGRGIRHTVCAEAALAPVEARLRALGLWAHLTTPSIAPGPKAARLAALVAAAQAPAERVLVITAAPESLAEARTLLPGLQVAGPSFIPLLRHHPLFQGGGGQAVAVSQQPAPAAAARFNGETLAFLRASHIRVQIEYDIEPHLDAVIALVNGAGQLNFTQSRLPEEREEARLRLRAQLSRFDTFAGLVRVIDDYGDYGIAGFYCGTIASGARSLTHFCFSCRIMSMGIEAYIYQRLGSPKLEITGAAAGDPFAPGPFDWITLIEEGASPAPPAQPQLIDRLVLRGGCDLQALSHYLRPLAGTLCEEYNLAREGRQFRIDHALLLPHLFTPPQGALRAALEALGYRAPDWTSALATPAGGRQVWMLSFWTDDFLQLYKHKRLDLTVPFLAEGEARGTEDLTRLERHEARRMMTQDGNFAAWETLQRDYWCVGPLFEDLLRPAIARLMRAAEGQGAMVIFLLAPESWCHRLDCPPLARPAAVRLNEWLRAAAPAARFVDMQGFTTPGTAYPELLHYDRLVYQRAAAHVAQLIAAQFPA